jgi:hypothetical protein
MRPRNHPPDRAIASLAARQHGVVAHRQLREIGLGPGAIKYRVRSGRLHGLHRGVYAVAHPAVTMHGDWMAAVLAAGPGALLSHRSAGQLWGIVGGRRRPIAVLVARTSAGKREGLTVHRTRSLHTEDRAVRDRIPVTSVARTLLELGCELDRVEHARVWEEATRLGLLDAHAVARVLERAPGRRPTGQLQALLDEDLWVPDDARAGLEVRFAAFCRSRHLPLPVFNSLVGGYLVDALWAERKLIAELDSRTHHGTWQARERDSERDIRLQETGYRVIRVTWRRLHRDPDTLEASIRRLLAAPA